MTETLVGVKGKGHRGESKRERGCTKLRNTLYTALKVKMRQNLFTVKI
jgi:hypothetical protein